MVQAVNVSDGERWGEADEALRARPPLTSCCAARFLTGHRPVPVRSSGVGDPCCYVFICYLFGEMSMHFFSVYFFLFSLCNLYFSIFMFTDVSSVPSKGLSSPFTEFFILVTVFFSSKIFVGSSLHLLFAETFYFFVEIFYLVICFKHICNCLLKHF